MSKRIAIHSVPRSGSSWVGQVFNSSPEVVYKFQPLFSYRFKNFLTDESTKIDVVNFFEQIAMCEDDFLDQKSQVKNKIYPEFYDKGEPRFIVYKEVRYHNILQNMLTVDDELILIGIIRNPLAVLSSWINAPREFRRDLGWNVAKEWRLAPSKNCSQPEEFFGYDKWKEMAILLHLLKEQFPDRVFLVNYSNLIKDRRNVIEQLFGFCGMNFRDQTKVFLKESKSKTISDPYSVYRSKSLDDSWRGSLDEYIVQAIEEDLFGTTFSKYLEI